MRKRRANTATARWREEETKASNERNTVRVQHNLGLLAHLGSPPPSNSPGFPLAIDKEAVEEEEGPLLDVACRDF